MRESRREFVEWICNERRGTLDENEAFDSERGRAWRGRGWREGSYGLVARELRCERS